MTFVNINNTCASNSHAVPCNNKPKKIINFHIKSILIQVNSSFISEMKRAKKTPTKVKTRKSSTSSTSSTSAEQNQPKSKVATPKQQKQSKETRVLVEESNESDKANVTIRLDNADSLAMYRNKYPHIQIENPKTTTNFAADEISDDDEI